MDTCLRRRRFIAFAALALSAAAYAQRLPELDDALCALARAGGAAEIPPGGRLGLAQALRDVQSDTCVAVIASHPDDQYVLPAAWLRLREGHRVVVVLLTRGEGGQNSEGPEVGDALGARRALETEACARRLGIEILHLNRDDAGYCRTGAEALELWGEEQTAHDLAELLRRVRPDVVMTTHNPGETHGHDLGLLAILPRAIALATDPQLDLPGLPPAPIVRVMRGALPSEPASLRLPVDEIDLDHGRSYREIAYGALVESHRSQAPFRPLGAFFGDTDRFLQILPVEMTPPEHPASRLGAPAGDAWLRSAAIAADLDRLGAELGRVLPRTEAERTELVALALAHLRHLASLRATDLDLQTRVARRREAVERLLRHAIGMRVDLEVDSDAIAVPGETLQVRVRLRHDLPPGVTLGEPAFEAVDPGVELRALGPFAEAALGGREAPFAWRVADDALGHHPLQGLFRRQRFEMPLLARLRCAVRVDADARPDEPDPAPIELDVPLELPCTVRPAVELTAVPGDLLLVADDQTSAMLNVRIRRSGSRPVRGRLRLMAPAGFDCEPTSVRIDMRTEHEQGHLFRVTIPPGLRPGPQPLRVELGRASIRVELHRVAVSVPSGLRVGLIEGVDDASHHTLRQLGCTLVPLTESELPIRSLDDLDTILIDIRALRHHAAARADFNRLIDYARRGGRLVMLYHKDTEFDLESTGSRFHPAELPFRIGKGRVTREDAPVELLIPDHPLFAWPNRIRPVDWDGWTQERCLYDADSWGEGFTPLLRLADPGQPAETGALIYGPTGDGEFIYCALALHRQLKSLHPGACRLFANLVTPTRLRNPDGDR
ncbi:MAG: PIG-L family deacetylase [Planctomycetes bacterium]|nr:PIG-L family deacetylase [Planctomycetota bacterium]